MRSGSLRACAAEKDIPVMIYEAGEALRFDEIAIKAGIRGIMRVLRELDMLPGGKTKVRHGPVVATSSSWVRAPASGIVTNKALLGQRVKKSTRLRWLPTRWATAAESSLPHEGHNHWLQ